METCIFCKIIKKEIPATVIAETDDIVVIKDITPKAPIHYLLIPKKHLSDVASFEQTDTVLAGKIFLMLREIAQTLPGDQSFRVVANRGASAGQSIFHVHFHILAGKHWAADEL
jgi:histidine triad (HIT) family protein